jgi:hypothetical protein
MRRLMWYVLPTGSLAFAVLVVGIDRFFLQAPNMIVALDGKLTATQLKSIDLLTDLAKLVIAAAAGLLGFLVYYIKSDEFKNLRVTSPQTVTMLFSTWFSLGSIYFGHRVISLVVEMLANDYFSIISFAVARAVVLQYVFLCCSVLLVILFVLLRQAPTPPCQHP